MTEQIKFVGKKLNASAPVHVTSLFIHGKKNPLRVQTAECFIYMVMNAMEWQAYLPSH